MSNILVEEDLVQIDLVEEKEWDNWHHSEFPHHLITVDISKTGDVIGITLIGRSAQMFKETLKNHIEKGLWR